jgi:hypothetical protein
MVVYVKLFVHKIHILLWYTSKIYYLHFFILPYALVDGKVLKYILTVCIDMGYFSS